MTMPYKALVATGDRWLDMADDTYRGGGGAASAAAEAAIANAYYARAALEKPNPIDKLMPLIGNVAGIVKALSAVRGADTETDAAMGRHPAGKKRPTHLREVGTDDDPN
jgi:hypothetical protein